MRLHAEVFFDKETENAQICAFLVQQGVFKIGLYGTEEILWQNAGKGEEEERADKEDASWKEGEGGEGNKKP